MNNLGTRTLVTERLILRKFTDSDTKDMFTNWASNKFESEVDEFNALYPGIIVIKAINLAIQL